MSSIKNNKSSSNCKCVFKHFNENSHDSSKDFRFLVLRTNIEDLKERILIESNYIHLFKELKIKILNDSQPNILFNNKTIKLFNSDKN